MAKQPVAGLDLGRRDGMQEQPHRTVLESMDGEPYTVGNWHQMLPDLLHPPRSWKHLFV